MYSNLSEPCIFFSFYSARLWHKHCVLDVLCFQGKNYAEEVDTLQRVCVDTFSFIRHRCTDFFVFCFICFRIIADHTNFIVRKVIGSKSDRIYVYEDA